MAVRGAVRQDRRRPAVARPLGGLLAMLACVSGHAQVSGEILVGRTQDALVAASPATNPSAGPDVPLVPGEFSEPTPVILPQPVYPRAARAARQEGQVVVCFTLDARGLVHEPVIRTSTDVVFNQPVLDAVGAARFKPARVGTQPVRSTACRTFRFLLR